MKKPRQNTARSHQLQAPDLASVRGGSDGVIHSQMVVHGSVAADNGVISANSDGVLHAQ